MCVCAIREMIESERLRISFASPIYRLVDQFKAAMRGEGIGLSRETKKRSTVDSS